MSTTEATNSIVPAVAVQEMHAGGLAAGLTRPGSRQCDGLVDCAQKQPQARP
ncbi:hypothetical protein LRH25_28370 [Ideonella azotifigens]|uniref:hypothetical protein n=1 Tax=Ideonella azotifigens TaxID=513160 RepID=UPI0014769677|nr:hypothetical protein [Ideonella azotifigens]MCD2344244.1 hypothetical protein [Ideonella azotifigens]